MAISKKQLPRILFLDIETVRVFKDYEEMPNELKSHWEKKCKNKYWEKDEQLSEQELYASFYKDKSGIFAEFAKIICISVGIISMKGDKIEQLRLKSFYDHDEKKLLQNFSTLLNQYFNNPNSHFLCGHNLREFDVPFMCRRLWLNRLPLPSLLDISGKRPWQTPQILDTLEMWKFGDYKNYTSLDLLSTIFGLPSPKDKMDGSMVADVYWDQNDLDSIAEYCEEDVASVVRLYLKFQQLEPLHENQIVRTHPNS